MVVLLIAVDSSVLCTAMVFYYCPSFEDVKELLAMAIHKVCPCADDVVDSAWRQWVHLIYFQSPKNKGDVNNSPITRSFSSSRMSSMADTVVRVDSPWYYFVV